MRREAVISECGKYRYRLDRSWAAVKKKACLFIMLNPSTADAEIDDPTIKRCLGFIKDWGFNHLIVTNLFAYRATSPTALKDAASPVGPNSMDVLEECVDFVRENGDGPVVCAWGAHGAYLCRGDYVLTRLRARGVEPMCLGQTKGRHPKHPLYLRADTELQLLAGGDEQ